MTKLEDGMIVEALETLAAAFPWDNVEIWTARRPEGEVRFSAVLNSSAEYGFEFASSGDCDTAAQAVSCVVKQYAGRRDPAKLRQEKIHELKEQIEKLQAVVVGLPPYVRGTYLSETVNV